MAIQVQGAGGSFVEAGAFAAEGMHVLTKPTDYGALGHYRVQVVTGTLAAALAASAQLFQFKWTDATRFAVVFRVWSGFTMASAEARLALLSLKFQTDPGDQKLALLNLRYPTPQFVERRCRGQN